MPLFGGLAIYQAVPELAVRLRNWQGLKEKYNFLIQANGCTMQIMVLSFDAGPSEISATECSVQQAWGHAHAQHGFEKRGPDALKNNRSLKSPSVSVERKKGNSTIGGDRRMRQGQDV